MGDFVDSHKLTFSLIVVIVGYNPLPDVIDFTQGNVGAMLWQWI